MVWHYCCLPLQYNHNRKPVQPELTEIGVSQDYLPPTGKSQVWWRAFGQPSRAENPKQSHTWWQERPSIDGSGTNWTAGHQSYHNPPLCPKWGLPTGLSQPPLPPFPGEDHSSPLCHSLTLVAGPCVLPCHFTFRGERGGRNLHYRW